MPRSYRPDIRSKDYYREYDLSRERRARGDWNPRYSFPAFDRFGVGIAAVVGLMLHFLIFTNHSSAYSDNGSGKQYDRRREIKAVQAVGDLAVRPVNASEVQTQIDPNFAGYLHMLAKKEADVLTGRKFLSVGSEKDMENDENEEAKVSKSKDVPSSLADRQNNKPPSSSQVVRLPFVVQDGYNITRVSQMLLRVIITQNIRSMVVVPCEKHMSWIGRFLEGTSKQLPKPFVFYCVDNSKRVVNQAEDVVGEIEGVNTNFIDRQFWSVPLPRADLLFSWDGLSALSLLHAHKMLDTVTRRCHHKFVLLESTPSTKQNSDRAPLNLRRAPFSYSRPLKMYKELYSDGSLKGVDKQLYLYEASKMKHKHKQDY